MKRFIAIVAVVIAAAGTASATSSTFYGTTGVDAITVGRGTNNSGAYVYMACINGTWYFGNNVTGSSDYVTVYGYGASDTITVQSVSGSFICGIEARTLYRMNYSLSCPAGILVYGGDGNDRIYGGQCVELLSGENGLDIIAGGAADDWLYGGTGGDCIEDDTIAGMNCGSDYDNYTSLDPWTNCEGWVATCFP